MLQPDIKTFHMAMSVILLINIQVYDTAFILRVHHIFMRGKISLNKESDILSMVIASAALYLHHFALVIYSYLSVYLF